MDTVYTRKKLQDRVATFTVATEAKCHGVYPYFRPNQSGQDTKVRIGGQEVSMLGSNSYLGLTNRPRIKEASKRALTNTPPVAPAPASSTALSISTWNWSTNWSGTWAKSRR